jgi:hypothetical protein
MKTASQRIVELENEDLQKRKDLVKYILDLDKEKRRN